MKYRDASFRVPPAVGTASEPAKRKENRRLFASLLALGCCVGLAGASTLGLAVMRGWAANPVGDHGAVGEKAISELIMGEPISPIPLEIDLDPRKVELGRRLFSDSRLSGTNGVSCASCHEPRFGMTDGMPLSRGLPGNPGVTNTLTLFNVGLNPKLAWDGHYQTLEQQARGVVESPRSMGGKWPEVISTLRNDVELTAKFDELYKEGLVRDSVVDALVQFQKSLITPNAPFDRFLKGDANAISEQAKAGYQLFKDYGCASCHQGVNVGGNMLQVFGIFGSPEAGAGGAQTPGSAKNTGISDDRPVFRVPVLRNVRQSGPYFHDGSVSSLSSAIRMMAEYQLGRQISEDDVAKLEAFLDSLTGEYKGVSVGDLR